VEGKEGAKAIEISLVSLNYRIWSQHTADYLFGSNHKVSIGFGRLRPWDSNTKRYRF